jgi:hypothetical protein
VALHHADWEAGADRIPPELSGRRTVGLGPGSKLAACESWWAGVRADWFWVLIPAAVKEQSNSADDGEAGWDADCTANDEAGVGGFLGGGGGGGAGGGA